MVVRRAEVEDAMPMARVMAEVAPEGFIATEPPVDLEERAERFRQTIVDSGAGAMWVLEDGSEVVGNAGLHEQVRGVLELGMAIVPRARGRGGGRALLEAMIDHARACGAHKLELQVWLDNPRAMSLYVSSGFEVEGLLRDHYLRADGSLRSALLMALRLRDDAAAEKPAASKRPICSEQPDDRDHADDDDDQPQRHGR